MRASKMRSRPSVLVLVVLATCGCGATPKRVDPVKVLPFTVRVNKVKMLKKESNTNGVTPALFDLDKVTKEVAETLENAGIFSLVLTENEKGVSPDLELQVEIVGSDFGVGEVKLSGAIYSTLAWLFAGHLSWFIDNREYPNSDVVLDVKLLTAKERAKEPQSKGGIAVFSRRISLKNLELDFKDRVDVQRSVLNILLPPWVGEGNSETAGRSLADQSVVSFAKEVPEAISTYLPTNYFSNLSSFLLNDPAHNGVIIVAQRAIQSIKINRDGELLRQLNQDQAEALAVKGRDRNKVQQLVIDRSVGTGTGYRYYKLELLDDERDYIQIEATFARSVVPSRWTIDRPAAAASPESVATARS